MPSIVALLEEQVAALARVESEVPGGLEAVRLARDPELLQMLRAAHVATRLAQAALVAVSGEVARRSQGDGDASLARRCGERSAVGLVANVGGVPTWDAARLIKIGTAVRPNEALSGEELQPDRPHLAEAVATGSVSLAAAELIDTTLTKVAPALWVDQADQLEAELIDFAQRATSYVDFRRFCTRIPGRLNPDEVEPAEAAARAQATITETRLPNGLLRVIIDLHPELEGWWRAAMAAKTAPRRQGGQGTAPGDGAADTGEADAAAGLAAGAARTSDRTQPTSGDVKLEALQTILRQALQADDGQAAGVDVTMLVTVDLETLTTGVGTATIADVDQPVSAATARRLACQAHLIPQVLDGRSVVLDQGLAKRIFTKHQRYALATRDQGCTFPGCPMPPGMCEVNHVGKWRTRDDHGHGSDLNNAALLCGWHNRMLERGWDMHLDPDAVPWFTPPPTIDPSRAPIRGGHLRIRDAA